MAQLNIKLHAYINKHKDPQSRMGTLAKSFIVGAISMSAK